jgi:hypothetical protein
MVRRRQAAAHMGTFLLSSQGDIFIESRQPTEYVWGYFKQHELPNLCAVDLAQLSHFGRKALGRMRRRPKLVTAFWKQAELW